MFDSWQIVSSKVIIDDFDLIAMSGRNEANTFERGWKAGQLSISTNNSAPFFNWLINQSAIIRSIRSCLVLNRCNETLELQNERTCLFVWMPSQSAHLFEVDLPQRKRLAAVGSCCCTAMRTKRKSVSGSSSTNDDQSLMYALEKESVMTFCNEPCIFKLDRWFWIFSCCADFREAYAVFLLSVLLEKLSCGWPNVFQIVVCAQLETKTQTDS